VALLGVEFLRFLDGQDREKREARQDRRHSDLLNAVVKGSLVATDRYDEQQLFEEFFPSREPVDSLGLPTTSDADVDFDYTAVKYEAPSEDELAILQRMLSDNSVTLPGTDFAEPEPEYDLPDARMDEDEIDNDREWV
jgi:hypothetical protein